MSERVELPQPPALEAGTLKAQLRRPMSTRELLLVLVQALLGAVLGAACMIVLMRSGLRLAPAGTNPALVLAVALPALFIAWPLQMLAHELGHALVGQWMGGLILRVILGPWRWERHRGGFRFKRVRAIRGIGGLAQTVLPVGARFRSAYSAMLLGGPLANLALAGLAWLALPLAEPWPLRLALAVFGAAGLFLGALNLLPFRSGGFHTDGLQLWQVWTDARALQMRLRAQRLMRASIDGLRPREYPAEDLAVFEIDQLSGMEQLWARMVHAAVAADRGEQAAANALMAPALADWDKLPDGVRQSLAAWAAQVAVEQDRDSAAARAWLARCEGGLLHGFEVDWVQAAIAALEGDHGAREAALARLRAALDDSIYLGDVRVYRERLATA